MNLDFDFPFPSEEEYKAVKELAKSNPRLLDGRDLWVLKNFREDFE